MKKIFFTIYTFIHHFFYGLRNADKIAFTNTSESDGNGGNLEVKDEADSVYKDLLKGEVTQEVRELRHEMYFSERESHNYEYSGAGRAKKRGSFDYTPDFPTKEDYEIKIVQDNSEDTGSVLDNLEEDDMGLKNERKYTISVERDFIPRFRIEEFANKLIVEKSSEDKVIIDFYITKYESQFNRRHKPFLNELERVLKGDTHSDIIDLKNVSFVSYKAWGIDDLNYCKYYGLRFLDSGEYNGEYILSFECMTYEIRDIAKKYYDKIADEKEKNHESRKEIISLNYTDIVKEKQEEAISETQNEIVQKFKGKDV